jgi:transcriptional regulator with XRE-family HTH domain
MTKDDLAIYAEMTLASAQVMIFKAKGKQRGTDIAKTLGCSRPYVSNLLSGGENLTLKQLGRVLAALGYEVRFKLVKIPTR